MEGLRTISWPKYTRGFCIGLYIIQNVLGVIPKTYAEVYLVLRPRHKFPLGSPAFPLFLFCETVTGSDHFNFSVADLFPLPSVHTAVKRYYLQILPLLYAESEYPTMGSDHHHVNKWAKTSLFSPFDHFVKANDRIRKRWVRTSSTE